VYMSVSTHLIRWLNRSTSDCQMHSSPLNLESIRRDIAERLRPSCRNMPDEEFEKMVTRMALFVWMHLNDSTPTSQMRSH
jgi:hypothetical protein